MNLYSVLQKPLVTEKSTEIREASGQYTFFVNKKSKKDEIRRAIEKLFDVKVESVNTLLLRGKLKRRGQHLGRAPMRKKAYVKLAEGQKLKLFEE